MEKIKSKPYYSILPPLFNNIVERKKINFDETKNKEVDVKNKEVDISLLRNFYKPVCSLIDLNNEVF